MITTQPLVLLAETTLDEHLLQTIETVLAQYQEWQTLRHRIHAQLFFDFQLDVPSQAQVCEALQHMYLFADALRLVAEQIEGEIEDTTDRFHTWLCD